MFATSNKIRALLPLFFLLQLSSIHADGFAAKDEMETFIDGVMTSFVALKHISGSVVSVVTNDEIFFSKGYGFSDFQTKSQIDPKSSLFKVASISKLFTCTAIMQLYERGKLDLDTNINDYLDFAIEDAFSKPITIKHLATHTAGFEDITFNYFVRDYHSLLPLGEYCKRNRPRRVIAPGRFSVYSNYGIALAGYIVERISGLPFEAYMQTHIFKPLDMFSSSFQKPLPDHLEKKLVTGYDYYNGTFHAGSDAIPAAAPNSGLITTANDMANFMLCHLRLGTYNNERILQPSTAREMHSMIFSNCANLHGNAFGFFVNYQNGIRILEHDGSIENFTSHLFLAPDKNFGVFISFSSDDEAEEPRRQFIKLFFNHYFPSKSTQTMIAPELSQKDLQQYSGIYIPSRRSYTRLSKLLLLLDFTKITAMNNSLYLKYYRDMTLKPVSQDLFIDEVDGYHIQFDRDTNGDIKRFHFEPYSSIHFDKVPFIRSPEVHRRAIILCILVFFSVIFEKIFSFYVRKNQKKTKASGDSLGRKLANISMFVNSFLLCFFAVTVGYILTFHQDVYSYGEAAILYIILTLPIISIPFTIYQALNGILSWIYSWWKPMYRLFFSAVSLFTIIFLLLLSEYNLLGYNI